MAYALGARSQASETAILGTAETARSGSGSHVRWCSKATPAEFIQDGEEYWRGFWQPFVITLVPAGALVDCAPAHPHSHWQSV